MPNDKLDSLMEMFIFEANQLMEQLESILLESEEKHTISVEHINEIFRIMHTIKGSAAMMSLNHISAVAHNLEDMFFFIREEKPSINVSRICDLVFKALDYIRYKIEVLGSEEAQEDAGQNDEKFLEMVKSSVKAIKDNVDQVQPEDANVNPLTSVLASDVDGKTHYKTTVFFDEYCTMVNVRAFMVVKKLSDAFGQVSHFPDQLTSDDNVVGYILENGIEINFSSELDYYEIKDFIEDITDVKTAVVQTVVITEDGISAETDGVLPNTNAAHANTSVEFAQAEKEDNRQTAKQSIISVNINKLDKLIDIVGEIVISESMVIKSPDLAGLNLENFQKSARHLRKLTDELQDLVLSVRMIPVEMIFSKMHRIVRDMSKKLDKEVSLEIIGESTEVDKNVIDHLSDPLMHLIRNCMDHGLETKDERIKSGKNPIGKITLEAKNTGGDVIITVSDDGRGLDKQRILNKAKESGLLSKNDNTDALSDKEIYSFILLPGFSTKEQVTEFSGRGVGMDVVKQNIESVRGSINVDSEQGKGTTFTIKIPLTLAIIDGMMVKVGDNVYIIPTQSIVQSFRPNKGSVFSDTEDRDMIIIRGNCYPVTRLHQLFNVETEVTNYSDGIIILTEYNEKHLCLFADNLLGEQAVVVKSLPNYLSRFRLNNSGVGGCTILGNGSISLILDIAEIANNCL